MAVPVLRAAFERRLFSCSQRSCWLSACPHSSGCPAAAFARANCPPPGHAAAGRAALCARRAQGPGQHRGAGPGRPGASLPPLPFRDCSWLHTPALVASHAVWLFTSLPFLLALKQVRMEAAAAAERHPASRSIERRTFARVFPDGKSVLRKFAKQVGCATFPKRRQGRTAAVARRAPTALHRACCARSAAALGAACLCR